MENPQEMEHCSCGWYPLLNVVMVGSYRKPEATLCYDPGQFCQVFKHASDC